MDATLKRETSPRLYGKISLGQMPPVSMRRPCLAAYPFNTLNEVMEGVGAKVSSPVFFWKFPSATRRSLPRTAVIPSCFNLSITCDGIDRFPSSFPSLESVHSNAHFKELHDFLSHSSFPKPSIFAPYRLAPRCRLIGVVQKQGSVVTIFSCF